MADRPKPPLINVLRSYPTIQTQPWLYVLLESFAELSRATDRGMVADIIARRSRELFGEGVRGIIFDVTDDSMLIVESKLNSDVPHLGSAVRLTRTYEPGIIFEIPDFAAYSEERTASRVWSDAGFSYVITGAFGPTSTMRGYLTFLHRRESLYSDDELTLFAILANVVGLEFSRLDRARLATP